VSSHSSFILSPVSDILHDAVSASAGIGNGIETYPLCDYIMQSVFLKLTGSQEQKMKCITWEMATNDYEYRRTLLANDDKLGECSSYEVKNKIFKQLVGQIRKHDTSFDVKVAVEAKNILKETFDEITNIFGDSNLSRWSEGSFRWFVKNRMVIKHEHLVPLDKKGKSNLFENVLQDKYEMLYNHRNRIAHNTQSYQQNLPTLKTLANDDYVYENYFLYFTILVLVDRIFRVLYKDYLRVMEDNRI